MALSIQALLDPQDPPQDPTRRAARLLAADTTRAHRRDLSGLVPQATADSIMAVLGEPARRVQAIPGGGGGSFRLGTQQITLSPSDVVARLVVGEWEGRSRRDPEAMQRIDDRMGEVFAHEMAHQATQPIDQRDLSFINRFSEAQGLPGITDTREVSPDMQGFINMWMSRFDSLDDTARRDLLEDYFGALSAEETADLASGDPQDVGINEVMARSLERGFALARRADPANPGLLREEVREVDERYPGTREAYNFWIRNFVSKLTPEGE